MIKILNWSPARILSAGFAAIIFLGAILLCLPLASRNGEWMPFLNAIFTSASATCVTGLVLFDTWTQFSLFGQIVILFLIQIGGLGFMTAVMGTLMVMHKRIGLKQRSLVAESVGITQLGGIVRLSRRIIAGTILFEGGGAVLLALRFVPEFGFAKGIWCAVFHSVSAFCNAGFDIMGRIAPGSSLTSFYNDPIVILTISVLITAGGIGFIVWNDIIEWLKKKKDLNLHTRVVLISYALLLAVSTVLLLITERNGVLKEMNFGERLLTAFFHSVTPRTAGFNTVDISYLTPAGKALTIFLMFIGAAPGGTGGGVKITTFVAAALAVIASLKRQKDTAVWHYRLDEKVIRAAFCSTANYCAMALAGVFILCLQGFDLTDSLFESFSAIGTVGLSTGITPQLNSLSKIVVAMLMYAGRVGSLTVFLAVGSKSTSQKLANPVGKIIVG